MTEKRKRTYTVPVLLIIIVVLLTFIIMSYSKLLLTQQTHTTDQGSRLAERYGFTTVFVDRLHDGVEGLLIATTESERAKAMRLLGEAHIASGEATVLLIEAAHLNSGKKREEAGVSLIAAFDKLMGDGSTIATVGGHEGPLTEKEKADLLLIRDGSAQIQEVLNRFHTPSGEAGYRQMVTVGDWLIPALEASKHLEQLVVKL